MKKHFLSIVKIIAMMILVRYFFNTSSITVAVCLFLILTAYFLSKAFEAYETMML